MVSTPDASQVFVVHGRNQQIRQGVFRFLRAIGLNPIEWTKAIELTGKSTPYIGEILDAALDKAQAIVVVMTPDDEARLRDEFLKGDDATYENELTPQARPNVLFEAGLAFGRAPDRTVLVEIGILRPFSDIGGRHTIRLNNTLGRRQALAQRLQMAGCAVNLSGTDWHTEGDLEIPESTGAAARAIKQPQIEDSIDGKAKSRVEAEEAKILELIASGPNITINAISNKLNIHRERVLYHTDRLREGQYVSRQNYLVGAPTFSLRPKGRAFLVENDLI